MVLHAAVVEVRDQLAAYFARWDATIAVEQVGLVTIDHIGNAIEPLLMPLRIFAVPAFVIGGSLGVIKILPFRIGAVIRNARQRSGLVGSMTVLKPGVTRPKMLGHAEAQPLFQCGFAP